MSSMSRALSALLAFGIVFVSSAVMAQFGPGYEALQAGIQAANRCDLTTYKKNEAILKSLVKNTKDSAQRAFLEGFQQNYPPFDRTKCPPKTTNVRTNPPATGATGTDVYAYTWQLGNGQSFTLPVEEVTVSGGFSSTSTSGGVNTAASGLPGGLLGFDPTTFSPASAATGNFAASIGGQFNFASCQTNLLFPFVTNQLGFDTGIAISNTKQDPFAAAQSGTCTLNFYQGASGASRYAPEPQKSTKFPAALPPTRQRPPPPRVFFGVDANVYFFAGSKATINGIPGGPFGTATGADSFNFQNKYMFTVGGVMTVPISPAMAVALTGGFAELNQTVTYNCGTYCAFAPVAPPFSASQDVWVPGGYVGGRLLMPLSLPGFSGATIGVDYKHVFFGSQNVTLGSSATGRAINLNVSPDMDIVTARLALPFH